MFLATTQFQITDTALFYNNHPYKMTQHGRRVEIHETIKHSVVGKIHVENLEVSALNLLSLWHT
jgi:hypothetical protein